jgi:hypothetical protein
MHQALPELTAKACQNHEIAVQFLQALDKDKDIVPTPAST